MTRTNLSARVERCALLALATILAACGEPKPRPTPDAAVAALVDPIRIAVIGDYGMAGTPERDVATLVRSWSPHLVVTTGDNNYDQGAASSIDANVGQYYASFISPYAGAYGPGAAENAFFPALGNHDWNTAGAEPYLDYFTLPGNERYYDLVRGPVHLFVLDSDPHEPDGIASTSIQARWLEERLASSTSPWRVVVMHHPPYSSGPHGSTVEMQWPFRTWGASVVFAGHDHDYERIEQDGLTYFVNGVGGKSLYPVGAPVAGSRFRYASDYGAQRIDADATTMVIRFYARSGTLVDWTVLDAKAAAASRAAAGRADAITVGARR
jgi:hypothetical protein